MKYSQAKQGRIFIIRLEDGDIVHEEIERFAKEKSINAAALIIVGGADEGSKLIVGPKHGRAVPILPMEHILDNVHEIAGTGTLFPDEDGNPALHMHMTCGRKSKPTTKINQNLRGWTANRKQKLESTLVKQWNRLNFILLRTLYNVTLCPICTVDLLISCPSRTVWHSVIYL